MDKLVRFCREVATFGLTVALIAMLIALIYVTMLSYRVRCWVSCSCEIDI